MLEKTDRTFYNEHYKDVTCNVWGEHRMQLKKLNDPTIDQLFEAILTLKTVDECYIFSMICAR